MTLIVLVMEAYIPYQRHKAFSFGICKNMHILLLVLFVLVPPLYMHVYPLLLFHEMTLR